MFNFKIQEKQGSTQDMASKYENELVKLLCLPLESANRQLAVPNTVQNRYPALFFNGETEQNTVMGEQKTMKSLNEVNAILNSNMPTNCGDNTVEDSFESLTNVIASDIGGEKSNKSVSKKNKPTIMSSENKNEILIAKLEDMSIEMQKKKGLLGLQFKIYKTTNPKTKRLCTKYVCTHDGCGKQCENKWSFLDHNRHHTGYRPYKCEVCEKRFTQRGNLRQHLQIHK